MFGLFKTQVVFDYWTVVGLYGYIPIFKWFMILNKFFSFTLFLAVIFCLTVHTSFAESEPSFSEGLEHLLQVTTDKSKVFDSNRIKKLLEYILSDSYSKSPDYSGGIKNTSSAYYGYSIHTTMKEILQICYNPKIPACAILPESIRLSKWYSNNYGSNNLPELWSSLKNLKDNIIVKGTLYLQNTPDITTGAYYGYNSLKSGILMKYNGKTVYISVSKQKDVSEVGKKGFVLGSYNDLNYFYSGKPGLNKFGLGSVKSYLYDGFSVSIYIESKKDNNIIQCGTFKWLKGGWAGLNFIKRKHIYSGLKRFAKFQKKLLESNKLPDYSELVNLCSRYNSLSELKMKKMMGAYFLKLQQECRAGIRCPEILQNDFNPDEYIDNMSKEEMKSALIVDNIKNLLYKKNSKKELIVSLNN